MGAVSGQLSPVVLSCVDPTDLANKPIGSLLSGDLAYVESLKAAAGGALFYLDLASVLAVDGITVLATSAPEGRWLSVASAVKSTAKINPTTAVMSAPLLSIHETFKDLKAAGDPVVVYTDGAALPAVTLPGHPRTLTVTFGAGWAVNDGITISGVGPDGNIQDEDVLVPALGVPVTLKAFFSVTAVTTIGAPVAGSTATITVGAGIGVANSNNVASFYECVVDGVENGAFNNDATNGTFYPSIAYTGGSQTVEIWYRRALTQNPHNHTLT